MGEPRSLIERALCPNGVPSAREARKHAKERDKIQKELLAGVKKPEELIVPVNGLVKKVTGINCSTSIHRSNGVYGPGSYSTTTETGYQKRLTIEIESQTPLKIIEFYGSCSLQKGDEITAYIIKGKFEKLPMPIFYDSHCGVERKPKTEVLVEGELVEKMTAVQIDIPSRGITDYGVNYDPEENTVLFYD